MQPTAAALWLNQAFAGYDHALLSALHTFAVATNGVFTPLMRLVSLLGEGGVALILLSLALFCFRRTRQMGLCMLLALAFGALITNVAIKPLVARPRPFADTAGEYYAWWQFMGASHAGGFSFPSGHTTAAMAAMTGLALSCKKRRAWFCLSFAVLMGISRNYLVVHYPSDVLAGFAVGLVAALLAAALTKRLARAAAAKPGSAWGRFWAGFSLAGLRRKAG